MITCQSLRLLNLIRKEQKTEDQTANIFPELKIIAADGIENESTDISKFFQFLERYYQLPKTGELSRNNIRKLCIYKRNYGKNA